MATIGTVIVKLYEEPRPCEVTIKFEVHKALFHCWGNGYAIVEMDDGSVLDVYPNQVRFLDSAAKFNEYAWNDRAKESDGISEYDRGYSDAMYFKNTYSPQELENDNDENWND